MSGAVHADRRSEGRCTASGYLCWKAYLPRSSWPTQPTTPIICARPSLPKARSPSSPTTRHGRSNIRSTSISMPSAISWSAAAQNSNNSAASQPASKRQPEITVTSSLSQPSYYGCDKCPHHLEHDPEKWIPVFPRDKRGTRLRGDHAQIKEIERDDDSKKSHHALGLEWNFGKCAFWSDFWVSCLPPGLSCSSSAWPAS